MLISSSLTNLSSSFIHCCKWDIEVANIIVQLSISPFNYVSFCFMYFGALLLGPYMFMTLISCWMNPFIIIKFHLVFSNNLCLKESVF